jgi:hypothetical protein
MKTRGKKQNPFMDGLCTGGDELLSGRNSINLNREGGERFGLTGLKLCNTPKETYWQSKKGLKRPTVFLK